MRTVPPVGVFLVAGCGADLLINICLTILGFFPGHIHAFYVEYVYYHRKDQAERGIFDDAPAPGVFSRKVQTGGMKNYGTVQQQHGGVVGGGVPPPPPPQQGYYDANASASRAPPPPQQPSEAPPPYAKN